MTRISVAASVVATIALGGCVTPPMGPTARVLPAPGKPFEVFAQEQAMCKQFAAGEVDGDATTANLKELGTAALSTALGAGLGAAVHGQRGAGIGGGVGAIAGALSAGHGSAREQYGLQGRYDLAYSQCMYSRGNQVAGAPQVAYGPRGGQFGGDPPAERRGAPYDPPGSRMLR